MKNKIISRGINTGLLVFFIAIPLVIAELGFRAFLAIRQKPSFYKEDPITGWAPAENVRFSGQLQTLKGRKYMATYVTNELGLRIPNSNPREISLNSSYPLLLAIGDSFTGDFFSSNEDSWFGRIQQKLPVRVMAYGMGGSGTYQQYLAFKKLYPKLNPDILLIQFCTNDIGNDSLDSSYYSIVRNQELRRPYNVNGKTYFRNDFLARLYRVAYASSEIFKRIDSRLQGLQYRYFNGYGFTPQSRASAINAMAKDSWAKNYRQYVDSAQKAGIKKIWSISCTSSLDPSSQEYVDLWLAESKRLGVTTLKSFADSYYKASLNNIDIYAQDGGHLNDIGNKIAGDALSNEIKSKALLRN